MAKGSEASGHLWFLNTLVKVRIAHDAGQDGITVLEHHVPFGDSPPLHIHRTEDEVLQILAGEFRFRVNGVESRAGAGETVFTPKGTPHTYRAESAGGGQMLTITARGDFARFVQAMARPAETVGLPPANIPTAEAIQLLKQKALQYGIEIVGPPLQ
jgi:quercetin dioxygenase-like cupin family protein